VEGAEHLVLQGLDEYLQNGRIRSYSLSTGGSTSSPSFFFEISISCSSDTARRVGKIYLAGRLEDDALHHLAERNPARHRAAVAGAGGSWKTSV
jgi:hypothetical protein